MEPSTKKEKVIKVVKRVLLIIWLTVAAVLFAAVLLILNSGYIEQMLSDFALQGVEYTISEIDIGTFDFLDGIL